MLYKETVLKNFAIFKGRHLCWSLFFNKVAGLQACNLIKKRLQHSCFPVKIANFLKTSILKNIYKWVLLSFRKTFKKLFLVTFFDYCAWQKGFKDFQRLYRVWLKWSWFVIHDEVLNFPNWILSYHEPFDHKIKKINQGNYQWIYDIFDNTKVISTLWTLNYGDCAPFFLFFLFFPYCWQSSQSTIMIKPSFIWLLYLTLSVNFQITLVLMKSKVCVS